MTDQGLRSTPRKRRKGDLEIALVMLVVGGGLAVLIAWATSLAIWGAILSGLAFWPAAFIAGAIYTRNEEIHVDW